jgi:uncharacterized protein YigA (DUF484 family)
VSAAHDSLDRLDDEVVARYLREYPEFFARHPRLLAELKLPHERGTAVSLIERQVTLLRERNIDTRKRLAQLVATAHANDALFEKTRRFTLHLLDAHTPADIDDALGAELLVNLAADHVVCHYVHPVRVEGRHLVPHESGAALPLRQLSRNLSPNGSPNGTPSGAPNAASVLCGTIRDEEYRELFGESAGHASAVLVALQARRLTGILAIGSRDPARFSAEMGSLFARYLGDVLARVLERSLGALAGALSDARQRE